VPIFLGCNEIEKLKVRKQLVLIGNIVYEELSNSTGSKIALQKGFPNSQEVKLRCRKVFQIHRKQNDVAEKFSKFAGSKMTLQKGFPNSQKAK
jgi:hypothetical protein